MSVASYCHQRLVEQGTLPLADLAAAASAAGVTKARNPEQSVRNALRDRAVELPGGRWASALRLLEGRCLTTRNFSPYDVGLLLSACRNGPVPIAQGGELRTERYGEEFAFPDEVKQRPGLVALRVLGGVLNVEQVEETPDLIDRGAELAGRLTFKQSYDYDLLRKAHRQLWSLLDKDPNLLLEPLPPFSECVPGFVGPAREDRERQLQNEAYARYGPDYESDYGQRYWPTVELNPELSYRVEQQAAQVGTSVVDWVRMVLERELDRSRAPLNSGGGNVIAFPSRLTGDTVERWRQ